MTKIEVSSYNYISYQRDHSIDKIIKVSHKGENGLRDQKMQGISPLRFLKVLVVCNIKAGTFTL